MKKKVSKPNVMFPGRPYYKGPDLGVFGLLYHDVLFEYHIFSGVRARVRQVKAIKPKNEVPTRLHNMISLERCRAAQLYAKKSDEHSRLVPKAPFNAAILRYIERYIPDHAWNGKTLKFPPRT